MTMQKQKKTKTIETSTIVQMFVYRIPKKFNDAWFALQQDLTAMYKKNGVLYSEFYHLSSTETFAGFENISKIISTFKDEEDVWIEIDHYKDLDHRNIVVESINKDPAAGPLFKRLTDIGSPGHNIVMGEFSRNI